ncbi:hypothetical protein CaCOL14_012066 [Colletotrichum acutatum]|uniref:Uncharacterized protein n=1 Tax=Glomerella acutata TaxID=27357 RepID=A0AAD8XCA0_GLOAC|nr:uncharacterized protein BDZ83DRAFT_783493 [Colletotrichum acutatum]KAK1722429.1 hypothetical protein BDZ83DRAFT_783493 [Colletotrichum acutatum]
MSSFSHVSLPIDMEVDSPPTSCFGSSSSFLSVENRPIPPVLGNPFLPSSSKGRLIPPAFGAPSSLSSSPSSSPPQPVGSQVGSHTDSDPTEDLIQSFSSFTVGAGPLPPALTKQVAAPIHPLSLMAARVAWAKCKKSKCSPSGNHFRQNHPLYRKYSNLSLFSSSPKNRSKSGDIPRGPSSSSPAPANPFGPKPEGVRKRRARGKGRGQAKQQQTQGNGQTPPRGPRNSSLDQRRSYPQPARGQPRGSRPNRNQGPRAAQSGNRNPFTPAAVNPFSQPLPQASAPAPPSQPRNRRSRGGSRRNPITL